MPGSANYWCVQGRPATDRLVCDEPAALEAVMRPSTCLLVPRLPGRPSRIIR